ncbi:hypothetical protein EXIGLDRAFT_831055 [Exidia glandulosa HHB12029]|uniref:Uncharacterized protein n=1 Tax=Exidia glandulosa HHB12029 TaxID=1314781 RepID=A0A165MZ94_EXIGL|nr:hypothetical protein EXIGLDRAFT_831055 [Exidia glandulosa HHB12029]
MPSSLLSLLPAALTALWVDKGALYVQHKDDIVLCYAGRVVRVPLLRLRDRAQARGRDTSFQTLQLLVQDSLRPLTVDDADEIAVSAVAFLSAFSQEAAWRTGTARSPVAEEGRTPATVFLRNRFQRVQWEWQIESSVPVDASDVGSQRRGFELVTRWTAWAEPSADTFLENPLVARGHIKDWIELHDDVPLIARRAMVVDNLLRPELLQTTTLYLLDPSKQRGYVAQIKRIGRAVAKATQKVAKAMQKIARPETASVLIAASALLSSVQGIVVEYVQIVGIVLGVLGPFIASVTVVSILLAYGLRSYQTASASRTSGNESAMTTGDELATLDVERAD